MDYLIGDIQGCCDAFDRLLAELGFSPSRDRIHVVGDLVNRGPASLATLRRLRGFGDAALCLLGNHDLSLLAVAHGVRRPQRGDTVDDILSAPDRDAWLDWLRARPLAASVHGWLLVHAGVVPQWTAEATLRHAAEVEAVLRGDGWVDFLPTMFGNEPSRWDDALDGAARLRFIVNVLTRTRYVREDGSLDMSSSAALADAPPGAVPWFDAPDRRTRGVPIAFGHWASLGFVDRPDLLGLDTGCVWGRQLSAVRVDGGRRELFQVACG